MKKTINLGKSIANLRKEKGKTAEQMAEALNVTRQTISKWENSETIPNAYQMADIATFLDESIMNIYVQPIIQEEDDADYINSLLDPKNIKEAIIAYDRTPNKLSLKVGVNVITYRDILLLATNLGYF